MNNAFSFVVAAPGDRSEDVLLQDRNFLGHSSRGRKSFHFCEEPGGTESSAADHDGVHAVAVETLACAFGRTHVPVPYYRYMYARVGLDFADECPVRLAAIHLRTGTAMNGELLYPAILQPLRQIYNERRTIAEV